VIYSLGQSVPLLTALNLVRSQHGYRCSAGARLFCAILIATLVVHAVRCASTMFGFGGAVSLVDLNPFQAALVVILMLLATACNFGGLIMAIDRLRSEVADLALLDELTGVANRRHLFQRLNEECARATATKQPFALLAIDLDGFKTINDSFGHGAGDECLRNFSAIVQQQLRPGDLLARVGGDEFCIVLPATTLREGAMIARRVLDVCRQQTEANGGSAGALSASIGVAQWQPEMGLVPEPLIVAADHALYAAKNAGKNRYWAGEPAPAPPPFAEVMPLLKSA
jgi:diguanylate cyclase (GGDEF)-like protein